LLEKENVEPHAMRRDDSVVISFPRDHLI